MKIFITVTSLFLFLINTSSVIANTKQKVRHKKLQSYGCKLIQMLKENLLIFVNKMLLNH